MILTTMVKISMKTYHIINNEKKIQRSFIAKSKDAQGSFGCVTIILIDVSSF